jgi:hypothetical protein
MTETALPPIVMGRLITGISWLPLRMPSSPEVTGPSPAAAGSETVAGAVFTAVLSPITETALPVTVIGAVSEASSWLPLRMPSSPEVTGPSPAAAGSETAAGAVFTAALSPMTDTALPDTVIGATTLATSWLPLRMPSSPVVTGPSAAAMAAASGAAAGAVFTAVLSPMTDTALPDTVIGTATFTSAWLPEAMASSPLVTAGSATGTDIGSAPAAGSAGSAAGSTTATLSPMTDTAFPTMLTGADTSMRAWLPDSSPSSPVVSAAFATVAPNSVMPPAISVPKRARLMMVCMISP